MFNPEAPRPKIAAVSIFPLPTLAGLPEIDGYQTKPDDTVLVNGHETDSLTENGVYVVKHADWERLEMKPETILHVVAGHIYAETDWVQNPKEPNRYMQYASSTVF